MYFILRCSIPASAFGAGHSTSYHWIEGLALRLVCTSQMSMCMHTHDYYETNPDNTIARRFNFSFNNCSSSGSVNIRIERNDVVFGNVHFEPSRIARRTQSKCSLFLFGWMSDSACECLYVSPLWYFGCIASGIGAWYLYEAPLRWHNYIRRRRRRPFPPIFHSRSVMYS